MWLYQCIQSCSLANVYIYPRRYHVALRRQRGASRESSALMICGKWSKLLNTGSPMKLLADVALWAYVIKGRKWILDTLTNRPRQVRLLVVTHPLYCETLEPPRAVYSAPSSSSFHSFRFLGITNTICQTSLQKENSEGKFLCFKWDEGQYIYMTLDLFVSFLWIYQSNQDKKLWFS